MTNDELTRDELEEQTGDELPDREEMSLLMPLEDPAMAGEEIFPAEPDIGDPATP
jgi:hypothetical protein